METVHIVISALEKQIEILRIALDETTKELVQAKAELKKLKN